MISCDEQHNIIINGVSRSAEPPSPPIFSKKNTAAATEMVKILKISEPSLPIRNKRSRRAADAVRFFKISEAPPPPRSILNEDQIFIFIFILLEIRQIFS